MGKVEVPSLPDPERQRLCCGMFVGERYFVAEYIMQKLGVAGLQEFNDLAARVAAEGMRARGIGDALGFALDHATLCGNLWGSRVEVEGDSERAILRIEKCMNLEVALELAKKGLQTNREMHCNNCINGYFKKVAKNLGLRVEATLTAGGCEMEITGGD